MFYRVFIAELIRAGNFLVSQEGDVRDVYRQFKIYPNQELDIEKIRIMANRLDVQLIFSGSIVEMVGGDQSRGTEPVVAVNIHIMRDTGEFLWATYHRKAGADARKFMHFGVVNTATELARMVAEEIVTMWFQEGLAKCTD